MIRGSLAWLLAPVDRSVFLAEHFEKRALVARGDARRCRGLPTLREVDRAVTTREIRHPDLRMAREGASLEPRTFTRVDGVADPILVAERVTEGATLILNDVQTWSAAVARICAALGREVHGRAWANLYVAPPQAHGFVPHIDETDVFVLQLRGEKHWALYEPAKEFPPLTPISRPFEPVGPPLETVVLRPGDVLYIPRGQPHSAETHERDSIHITIAVTPATWVTALHAALHELAERDERVRHAIPFDAFRSPEGASAEFKAMLRSLADGADLRRSLGRVHAEVAQERSPLAPGQIAAAFEPSPVTIDTVVSRRPAVDVAITPGGDVIELSVSGRTISLPRWTRKAVRHALTRKRFRVGDLPDDLDDDAKVVLVKRLLREGIVRVERPASESDSPEAKADADADTRRERTAQIDARS